MSTTEQSVDRDASGIDTPKFVQDLARYQEIYLSKLRLATNLATIQLAVFAVIFSQAFWILRSRESFQYHPGWPRIVILVLACVFVMRRAYAQHLYQKVTAWAREYGKSLAEGKNIDVLDVVSDRWYSLSGERGLRNDYLNRASGLSAAGFADRLSGAILYAALALQLMTWKGTVDDVALFVATIAFVGAFFVARDMCSDPEEATPDEPYPFKVFKFPYIDFLMRRVPVSEYTTLMTMRDYQAMFVTPPAAIANQPTIIRGGQLLDQDEE